jgi:hypothetical protein
MGTINDAYNLLNVSQFPSFNDGSQVLSYKWVNKNHVKLMLICQSVMHTKWWKHWHWKSLIVNSSWTSWSNLYKTIFITFQMGKKLHKKLKHIMKELDNIFECKKKYPIKLNILFIQKN